MPKIAVVLGTRQEIIKMSPVIRECERLGLDFFTLHTGQHHSYITDKVFFEDLELPNAKYTLGIGSCFHGEQTGKMLVGIERVLRDEMPDIVLVHGDTDSALAGALGAMKLGIEVGHVEAGLRSRDRRMPEEVNRILTDHCSDYLFAPTEESKRILLSEGVPPGKIFVTGNTVVDAIYQNLEIANRKRDVMNLLELKPGNYFLATAHRQENVDDKERFFGILSGLKRVGGGFGVPIVYPIHPRSRKQLDEFGLQEDKVRLIEPVDFLSFLQLEHSAKLVLTDSDGVQEEACVLGVPCVTLMDNTKKPETIKVGSNVLAGMDPDRIFECARAMILSGHRWENPFGEGDAGKRVIEILCEQMNVFGEKKTLGGRNLIRANGRYTLPSLDKASKETSVDSVTSIVKDELTVVVPTLNEEQAIGRVLQELQHLGYKNVLVVDGHSSDKTTKIAGQNGVEVVRQHGKGKAGAIRTAIEHVKTPYMLVMDGDHTYDPRDIERFLVHAREYDQIIGYRARNGVMGRLHRFGNWVITKVFNLLMDTSLSDVCSGMWLTRTDHARRLDLHSTSFDVEVEVATQTAMNGQITEVPIDYRPRIGDGKLGTWREGARILTSMLNLGRMYNPALLFSTLASFFVVPGLVILFWVALELLIRGVWHSSGVLISLMLFLITSQALAVATISVVLKRMEARLKRQMKQK